MESDVFIVPTNTTVYFFYTVNQCTVGVRLAVLPSPINYF